jgi:hypothetical protein
MQGYNRYLVSRVEQRIYLLGFIDAFRCKEAGVIGSGLGTLDRYRWSEAEDTLVSSDLTACHTKLFPTLYNSYSDHTHVICEPISGIPVLFFHL